MSPKKKKSTGGYEDISSYSTPKGFKNKMSHFWNFKFKTFFLKNHKRNLKALMSICICLVLVVSALGGAYVRKLFSLINHDEGHSGNPDATFVEDIAEDEDVSFNSIADIAYANSIKDLLRSWATNNGEKIHSKKVINVLLIGEDNEDGSHRSDSTMLVSVNTKTKKITITSFLRDSYTYMDINGSERFDKTNHSYAWGGAAKLMEVLSNNYKVKIDYYVSINYESFVAAVDALGGISVPITEEEARYMNRTTRIKGFTSGESVHLNGEQALIYARIRKLDSEVERTRRQRELISSLINQVKGSSVGDLNNAIQTFLPYVTTNLKTSQIISLGTQALSDGWLQYEIASQAYPDEQHRYGVDYFQTYTGRLFVWIVDYITAARDLQLALYNQTNIEINPLTHVSAIDLAKGSVSTGGNYEETTEEESTEYETHYYEEEETTRKNIFNWIGDDNRKPTLPHFNGEETTQDFYYYEETTEYFSQDSSDESYEYPEENTNGDETTLPDAEEYY
ncbi:MAG: LCP family protein [Clostridia bacterium]|nr:LCP family protein [Clostridia bacterium]